MVSPNLIKRLEDDGGAEVSGDAKKLFQVIFNAKNKNLEEDDETPKIHVSSLISKLSFFYEKVRNAVDYDEEHLLRKNAIERILKRQIVIEGVLKKAKIEEISSHLIVELIRGSYLSNDKVPETQLNEVTVLLEKYLRLKDQCVLKINSVLNLKTDFSKVQGLFQKKNNLIKRLLTLAACEIEASLETNKVKAVMVANMFNILSKNIKLPADLPYEKDLEIQIYLAISRTFLKFDADMLSLILFKYYIEEADLESSQSRKIIDNIQEIFAIMDYQLNHPLAKQLDKVVRAYGLYFTILAETVEPDPAKIFGEIKKNTKTFLNLVRKTCNKKYKKAKGRLWRAAVRSIIYIFLTKSIFVFIIEIPAIHWFGEKINYLALGVNVIFPALLLFFIVFLTSSPTDSNTEKIVEGVKEIAFVGEERRQPIILRKPVKRGFIINSIFNIIYAAAFVVSLYFIIWALTQVGFNWVSITIFLFFLAFVSFFSIITTRGIKELIIIDRKDNLLNFLVDLFYLPIISIGRWLSSNVSKINIFIFIFDFIIEAPFKVLIEIAEDWTRYVKERKDKMS
ncbi:MAG: hypothetical protein NTX66_02590 [Candidatus Falkowbacteria bacterium]|nr:hypothetical protein [Candidatus Falkowbacteria bacterium]